jgi:hypothetical protein
MPGPVLQCPLLFLPFIIPRSINFFYPLLFLPLSLCPTDEDLGMLMSSVVVNVHMFGLEGVKKGAMGLSEGTKNGAVDSTHGASKDIGLQLCTKSHHTK